VDTRFDGQLEFGADAIGAGDQYRLTVSTPGRRVRATAGLMRSMSSPPASISTPASR
jgi:hypothetical protein